MNWSISSRISSWWTSQGTLRVLYLLLLGQLISFLQGLCSLTSSLLADLGLDAPITQSSFNYFALALVYGSILLHRRHKLRVSWYWYLLLGFIDVQGNFLVNKAYQYSSITSVTLLDCFTVAWVIVLTYFIFGTRYSIWQILGAALCVLGLGLVLLSDAGVGGGGGSRPILGDCLVIGGTFFYAFSNVGEEFVVKKKDFVEAVAMLGTFGCLVSAVELSIVELKTLESVKWTTDIILALAGYTVSLFLYYTFIPLLLKLSGATLFNLSILTSDMWAVVFRILLYHQEVDWLYFVAFAVVAVGLIIYSLCEKAQDPVPTVEDGNSNGQYQVLADHENGETRSGS